MASSDSSSVNAPINIIRNDQHCPTPMQSEKGLIPIIDSSCAVASIDPIYDIVTDANFEIPYNTQSYSDSGSSSYVSTSSNTPQQLQFLHKEQKGTFISSVYSSPDGTKFWTPDVDIQYMPSIGSVFQHWDDAIMMYKQYASKAGFSVRISTLKSKPDPSNPSIRIPTHRYLLCSKNGKPKHNTFDSSLPPTNNKRRSRYTVSNCGACARFRYLETTRQFQLYSIVEQHNHCVISNENADLLRQNRQVTFEDQQFIHRVGLNKIGPSIAHNIQVSLKGGPQNVQGTTVGFKNVSRDFRLFVGPPEVEVKPYPCYV
ncbi:uncharacterized protein LOC110871425 [Helianthus annuus]|uniref:uncharacterized protein LOC110871425 n=1 Tax=Helianthus annuus TaxID=4232 RepID=UPI000B8F104F|nr:uncharacterized protein LOC110871425 [Helianthus annuus]XP_021975880.1 uncharacterized protein LOC110871425 [Helianthus annuus]XP_021975881.1 uncharacterized protein LOC110871425 [Helianthus annuus]